MMSKSCPTVVKVRHTLDAQLLSAAIRVEFFTPLRGIARCAACSGWMLTVQNRIRIEAQDLYKAQELHRSPPTRFKGMCNGTFAEIGANDGKTHSNTKFFEESLGWTGLCVEPNPLAFKKLRQERPDCINVEGGISTESGTMEFLQLEGYTAQLSGWVESIDPVMAQRIDREQAEHGGTRKIIRVPSYRLDSLFIKHKFRHIDFLSIDVEGAELEAVKSIDFDAGHVAVRLRPSALSSTWLRSITPTITRGIGTERAFWTCQR